MAIEVKKIRELNPIVVGDMNGSELFAIEDHDGLLKKINITTVVNSSIPKVVNQPSNLLATPTNHNNYTRFTVGGLTYTFNASQAYVQNAEYHGRNASNANITLVAVGGFIINTPTDGSLIIPPGGTFTVKIVATNEADLFGITESP